MALGGIRVRKAFPEDLSLLFFGDYSISNFPSWPSSFIPQGIIGRKQIRLAWWRGRKGGIRNLGRPKLGILGQNWFINPGYILSLLSRLGRYPYTPYRFYILRCLSIYCWIGLCLFLRFFINLLFFLLWGLFIPPFGSLLHFWKLCS